MYLFENKNKIMARRYVRIQVWRCSNMFIKKRLRVHGPREKRCLRSGTFSGQYLMVHGPRPRGTPGPCACKEFARKLRKCLGPRPFEETGCRRTCRTWPSAIIIQSVYMQCHALSLTWNFPLLTPGVKWLISITLMVVADAASSQPHPFIKQRECNLYVWGIRV